MSRRVTAIIALVLLGCASSTPERARSAASVSPSTAPSSSPATHAPAPVGPVVAIQGDRITIDGADAGSTAEVQKTGRLTKLDALHQALKARREQWKASHPSERFPGAANLEVAPTTSGLVFVSAFQTLAFAGYPSISVVVNGRGLPTKASVPGPPCGTPDLPCPAGPPKYVLHVQADHRGWTLRVPHRDGPVDLRSEGPAATPDGLLQGAAKLVASQPIGAIIFHVPADASFWSVAPYLDAIVAYNGREKFPGSVVVSAGGIEQVRTSLPRPIGADLSSMSGRLPAEVIQAVVRAGYAGFRDCYGEAQKADPTISGKAMTRFVIDPNGRVSEVMTSVEGTLPTSMGSCIEAKFRELVFPAPDGGNVTVVYPIRFSPAD